MLEQSFLTAAVQNMKCIAKALLSSLLIFIIEKRLVFSAKLGVFQQADATSSGLFVWPEREPLSGLVSL